VLIDRLPDGTLTDRIFAEQQTAERMLQLLGYLPMEEEVRSNELMMSDEWRVASDEWLWRP
jgi:hypothetical protein